MTEKAQTRNTKNIEAIIVESQITDSSHFLQNTQSQLLRRKKDCTAPQLYSPPCQCSLSATLFQLVSASPTQGPVGPQESLEARRVCQEKPLANCFS